MRFIVAAVVCLVAYPLWAAEPDLESRLSPLVKAHKGQVSILVKHLKTGESYSLSPDEVMPTASLIKLPVMVETYWQKDEGRIKFDTVLTLKKEDKVPGSGVLTQHFSDGATFPLRDAVRLMIVFSDNTATNMVLDQVGISSTNVRMEKLGLMSTKINSKSFNRSTSVNLERSKKYGLGSTTAAEMVKLLEMIEARKVVTPEACDEMLKHLKACEDKNTIARLLPPTAVIAYKTGAVSDARTVAGILYVKSGPVAFCILTNGNEDKRWTRENAAEVLLANIGKQLYEHFAQGK